jgi:hypothetical protein
MIFCLVLKLEISSYRVIIIHLEGLWFLLEDFLKIIFWLVLKLEISYYRVIIS